MDIRFLSTIFILLFTLSYAQDIRTSQLSWHDQITRPKLLYTKAKSLDEICDSCLDASSKAQQTLRDSHLFDNVEKLTAHVCHSLPSVVKIQCLEKSFGHLHQTKFFMKDHFDERKICNTSGICLINSDLRINTAPSPAVERLEDQDSCIVCRKAVRNIFSIVRAPRLRKKILDAMLDHCEEELDNEKECRQTVNLYGAKIMINLDKLRPNEVCHMINLCDEGSAL